MNEPRPLNTRAMAHRLRVTVKWLRDEAEAGRVPCLPAGRDFLFDADAVEAAILKRAREGQPA